MAFSGELPKILDFLNILFIIKYFYFKNQDASFLYGEKQQMRRLNNLKNLENT